MSQSDTSGPGNHELMESFRRGDREAFKWVFDTMCGDIFAFVEGIVKDRGEAEKIVSECFYRLFYQRGSMAGLEDIRRWLFLMGRQLCMEHLKDLPGEG